MTVCPEHVHLWLKGYATINPNLGRIKLLK